MKETERAGISDWMLNPRADLACGARDSAALLPEPVHYDCGTCKAAVVEILTSRAGGGRRVPITETQVPMFDDLQPRKPRKG